MNEKMILYTLIVFLISGIGNRFLLNKLQNKRQKSYPRLEHSNSKLEKSPKRSVNP